MDRVTESFLTEFCAQHDIGGLDQDKQFEHFASFVTVRRHYNGEAFDTSEIIVGSGGDTGIDAIAILVNGSLVTDAAALEEHADLSGNFDVTFVFVQADKGSSFDAAKIGNFGFAVKDFFDSSPRLVRNQMVKDVAEVMDALYKFGTRFRPGNPSCRLYYVTTGTWVGDTNLEARRSAAEDDLRALQIFRDVEFTCIGADGVQKLYRQTKNAVTREFTFTNRTLVPEVTGVNEAYIGYIPLKEFLAIVTDDDGDLLRSIFYDNVRDWQEYTAPVNDEIRETLASDHKDRFVLMNNGITVIAKTLRTLRRDQFQIEDFQIVNGCQTTHVLFDQRELITGDVTIPLRLIATQDEEVVKSIIRGTNRQTKVEDDQFFALTDFAEQLETFFQTFPDPNKLYYERRSGQYTRLSIQNTRIVTHRNLVRAVSSMFLSVPHQSTRSYKSLRGNIGKEIFVKGQRLEPYYVAALALYKLEVNFRTQRLDSSLKAARFQILLAMRLLANSAPLPRMNSHEMKRYSEAFMEILWDNARADDLCARAAELIKQLAQEEFGEENSLDRDKIHTQAFTERVIAQFPRTQP